MKKVVVIMMAACASLAGFAADMHLTTADDLAAKVAEQVAAGGGKVFLAAGTYTLTDTVTLSGAVEVIGESGDRATVIVDGASARRCFTISHADAKLANLTVKRGVAPTEGANIYMTADATVSNCVITGGTLTQSQANTYGGNVYMSGGILVDCSLSGGVTPYKSTCRGCSIYASGGRVMRCTIVSCTCVNEWSQSPIYLDGAVTMENCRVKGNKNISREGTAAVIYVNKTSAKVVNCTVVGNTGYTADTCRGIYLAAAGHVYNTVMYGNGGTAATEWGAANAACFVNCGTAAGAAITGGGGGACIATVTDASFNDYAGGDYLPAKESVLINHGTTWADYLSYGAISATDLAGSRRAAARILDIGCYESLPPAGTVVILR